MKKRILVSVQSALAGALGLLLTDFEAMASGFSVPEFSALGMGTANAVVANPAEPGTFAYNPAAMGFHDASSIGLGAILLNPKYKVTTESGSHDSENANWFTAPLLSWP